MRPQDQVFLLYGNRIEFFADLIAVWTLGGCAIPVDARLTPFEVGTLARAAEFSHKRPGFISRVLSDGSRQNQRECESWHVLCLIWIDLLVRLVIGPATNHRGQTREEIRAKPYSQRLESSRMEHPKIPVANVEQWLVAQAPFLV